MYGLDSTSGAVAELLLLAPLLAVLVAAVGAFVALRALRFRTKIKSAEQWWVRVENAVNHCLSDSTVEQNLGTTMLAHLQGQGELPDGLDAEQRREWERLSRLRWKVQPEDLAMIHDMVKDLALSKSRRFSSMGIRLNPELRPEHETMMRQAQLALRIDQKLGRDSDPEVLKIFTSE
ncbi:hypothetical protein CQ010_05520 [Arthrobacter sp. MYb211]|uniref:hypothetical protein n=1 Tax=unclassified Arthrobacter TaxID=235627 RepID=UPI000CFBCF1F|nr:MULTISPECIES: hypothetical protein [unclassified Arthrobacter]PRA13986.1 hypothetical protein CQ015_01510 [Arthrobacter sp. MYb221]PRC09357.1 hypothetical protein CQ010_05520 [Arthrobacter sp. MYb211]